MAGETVVTFIGNLTADPELRFTQNGLPVANFTIASTPRTFDRQTNEWKDGEALFLRASIWREEAEHVAASLSKGTRVIASGFLKVRGYQDKEGNDRTSLELEVQEIGPSLKYATAQVTRAAKGGGNGQQQGNQQQAPQQNYGPPQTQQPQQGGYPPPAQQGPPQQAPQQGYQQGPPQQGGYQQGPPQQQAPQQPPVQQPAQGGYPQPGQQPQTNGQWGAPQAGYGDDTPF